MIRGSCCSKSRLAKTAGAEVAVPQTGEKWHAAVAKSTFASQNAQNTTISDPFWKFRCSKMARGCGAKHVFKSKCTKHHNRGPLLEVSMFKNGTRLWREAHLQVKMLKKLTVSEPFWTFRCSKMARGCGAKHICKSKCAKHHMLGPLFDVPLLKNGTPLWREAHLQGKMYKTPAFCSILRGF